MDGCSSLLRQDTGAGVDCPLTMEEYPFQKTAYPGVRACNQYRQCEYSTTCWPTPPGNIQGLPVNPAPYKTVGVNFIS
jgi:hypothetical protein